MFLQQSERDSQPSPKQGCLLRNRKRLILKVGIGCLSLFVLGYVVISAVEKIQDISDRAH